MAVAIAYDSGVSAAQLIEIIPTLTGAPGRLESVQAGQKFTALVDYAHSPDAVANVLHAAQEFTEGRVIAVLGCGGDRDSTKRPLMGRALVDGSDISIFTSDNPRSESPTEILAQMSKGITLDDPSRICVDRADAIRYAVEIAREGDSVLILGKGHESGQDIAGTISLFDDRVELARAISDVAQNHKGEGR
jgi:UDP-N-acetylmuramoyl-L-alanyl-D-glutamate--2,6-diaminopimelate ligase